MKGEKMSDEYESIVTAKSAEDMLKGKWLSMSGIVRCKDCKHYIADGCDECELMSAKSIIASISNKRWHSDFYCAWGERREDDT